MPDTIKDYTYELRLEKTRPHTFKSLGKIQVKGYENETEIICVKV